jgi:DNA-directed RNA polymerase specialized sigma24 family protein
MQVASAPTPSAVRKALARLPEFSPLPGRPIDDTPANRNGKFRGNRHELAWATRGELLGCIEKLPPRQRDSVITCSIKGLSTEIVAQRWGIAQRTVYKDQHRAFSSIARMLGWNPPGREEMAAD